MLLQFPEILSYITAYLPPAIYTAFSIAMLAYGYLIRKNNGYAYGTFFMISALFSIIPHIIYFTLNYLYLPTYLFVTLGLHVSLVSLILTLIGILFTVLNVISAVFLLIAVYSVYKTHKTPRTEPNTK